VKLTCTKNGAIFRGHPVYTYRSRLVEHPNASTWRWLPHAEPTRVNAGVLKVQGEVIRAAFLEHTEVQLLRQNRQSSHLAHRLAALRCGTCPRHVVHLTSNGLLHLRKLPQKHHHQKNTDTAYITAISTVGKPGALCQNPGFVCQNAKTRVSGSGSGFSYMVL